MCGLSMYRGRHASRQLRQFEGFACVVGIQALRIWPWIIANSMRDSRLAVCDAFYVPLDGGHLPSNMKTCIPSSLDEVNTAFPSTSRK